jgi:hypothetical protein
MKGKIAIVSRSDYSFGKELARALDIQETWSHKNGLG